MKENGQKVGDMNRVRSVFSYMVHVTSGFHIRGWGRYRTFLSSQKVLLDSAGLDGQKNRILC